jgi:iron(III) transport system substrate-binding protein
MIASALAATALIATSAVQPVRAADEVNLYSYRQPFLINPFLEAFTEKTGIKVNVVFAEKGMMERLKAEGRNTPADVVLTVDIARISELAEGELLAPVESEVLTDNIPPQFRDPHGLWFGLTTRARVVYAHKDRVKPGEIATYDDLADPKWKGRICTRSGKHDYNIGLLAAIIAVKGERAAEEWARGVKANLARKPQGNDRAQVKAIHQGQCDIALANTYYMGAMQTNEKEPEQKEWAASVRLEFPKLHSGTHVNISGAAVTEHAKNRAHAIKLLEFLSGDVAQHMYAATNFEYPVKPGVEWDPRVRSWGAFTPDDTPLAAIAMNRATASKIMDRVGYDN